MSREDYPYQYLRNQNSKRKTIDTKMIGHSPGVFDRLEKRNGVRVSDADACTMSITELRCGESGGRNCEEKRHADMRGKQAERRGATMMGTMKELVCQIQRQELGERQVACLQTASSRNGQI